LYITEKTRTAMPPKADASVVNACDSAPVAPAANHVTSPPAAPLTSGAKTFPTALSGDSWAIPIRLEVGKLYQPVSPLAHRQVASLRSQ
jgi:pyocin large subunit-like protein